MRRTDPRLRRGSRPRRPTGWTSTTQDRPAARRGWTSHRRRRVTVIASFGEIDMAAAGGLARCLQRAIERNTDVVLDLTDVTFLDCFCLGVLVRARRQALLRNRIVCLAAPSGPVARVLRVTDLDTLFPTFPHADAALAHVGAPAAGDRRW